MSKAKRTVEERIAELNKREQDMLEKASRLRHRRKNERLSIPTSD